MSSVEILADLAKIANEGFALAVAWHAVIAIVLWRVALGARPSRQAAGVLLALPLASVAGVAFAFGNPVNGLICAGLTLALATVGTRLDASRVHGGPAWAMGTGIAMMIVGWVYPHFLDARTAWAYLIGAPLGLLPCPTLFFLVGAALLCGGLGSRAWSVLLAAAGTFYGLVGALFLQVRMDIFLAAGSLALLVSALQRAPVSTPSTEGRSP